ncbi:putative yegI [Gossypium arboreum]|uniref:Putative yegI n=1 Tax=Gossypium arboreum TaxID=29729 RepID=A0A0B0MA70_GOSAR|nr:putative yegI [Gossypium arboreum]KHG16076.1 putative yegI [Gossypium arboreum]
MAHGLAHGRVTWPCCISQYTLQVWHNLVHGLIHGHTHRRVVGRVTQVSMYALFSNGLGHERVWSYVRHTVCSHGRVTLVYLKFL